MDSPNSGLSAGILSGRYLYHPNFLQLAKKIFLPEFPCLKKVLKLHQPHITMIPSVIQFNPISLCG